MEALLRFCSFIDRVNERIGRAASWLTLLAVVVCTVNALVRYSVNMSSNAWLEMQWYLNSGMFLLVAAYALKINAHVRIDVIAGKLSPRVQAGIDIFGGLFFLLPVSLIIAWYSWPALVSSWNINEMSSDHGGLIRWPMRSLTRSMNEQNLRSASKILLLLTGRADPADQRQLERRIEGIEPEGKT